MSPTNKLFDYLEKSQQTDSIVYLKAIWKSAFEDEQQTSNLSPEFLKELLPKLKASERLQKELIDGLSLFEDLPFLKSLLYAAKDHIQNGGNIPYNKWPLISQKAHTHGNLLGAYLIINSIPDLVSTYEHNDWPVQYCYDLFEDISLWLEDTYTKNTYYHLNETGWISNHFGAKIFQIGRLQFEFRKDYNYLLGFKHKTSGALAIFVAGDKKIRQDGQFDGANNINDNNAFTTTFTQDEETIVGHLVNPTGKIETNITTLKASQWELILKEETDYIAVHIPASGPITPEVINDSFEKARDFFAKYFPDYQYDYFGTKTWFMDNQIEQYRPESNIAKWQQSVYLTPVFNADEKQCYQRVFGYEDIDINTVETKSSLQKVIKSHVQNGGQWRNAFFYLLKDDLPLKLNHYRRTIKN